MEIHSLYVTQLSGTDPTFAALRAKHYRKSTWFETGAPEFTEIWNLSSLKAGPFSLGLLSPALGYEARARARPSDQLLTEQDFLASLAALSQTPQYKKADLIQYQALTLEEAQALTQVAGAYDLIPTTVPYRVRTLSGYSSFKDYTQKFAGDQLKTLARNLKKATAQGFVLENKLPAWDDIVALLDKRKPEFENGTIDYTADPTFRAFYRELLEVLASQGRLIGFGLRTREGKLVSYAMGFKTGTVFHWYQTAYDPEFAKMGAGSISLGNMIEQCFDQGLELFDFMGDQNYFERWSPTCLELKRVTLLRPTLKGRAFGLYKKLRSQ